MLDFLVFLLDRSSQTEFTPQGDGHIESPKSGSGHISHQLQSRMEKPCTYFIVLNIFS
jgi:hypothetical protein